MSDTLLRFGRWIFYSSFIALIVLSFLGQMLRGQCPV